MAQVNWLGCVLCAPIVFVMGGPARAEAILDNFNDGVLGSQWQIVTQTGGAWWDESGGALNAGGSSGTIGELVLRYNQALELVGTTRIDYQWISYSGHKARVGLGLFDSEWGDSPLNLDAPGAVWIKGVRYQTDLHAVDARVSGNYDIAYSVPTSGSLMIERNVDNFRLSYLESGNWQLLLEATYPFGETSLYPYLFTSNSDTLPSWQVALDNFHADVVPEPSTLTLCIVLGAVGILAAWRRRKHLGLRWASQPGA